MTPQAPINSGEFTAELAKLATDLAALWQDVNAGTADAHGDGGDAQESRALLKIASGEVAEPSFPVYGAVKAGKSTFLVCCVLTKCIACQLTTAYRSELLLVARTVNSVGHDIICLFVFVVLTCPVYASITQTRLCGSLCINRCLSSRSTCISND
jgi:hypothetical protein